MYKVFVKNRPVILTDRPDQFIETSFGKHRFVSKKKLELQVEAFEHDKSAIGLMVFHYDLDELFYYFRRICRFVKAAGGVVQNKDDELLFIFRKQKWDLPKGKLDGDEHPREAALREVQEECGVGRLRIENKLCDTYHTYWENDRRVLKKTYWFTMKTNYEGRLIPQLEEDITDVKWLKQGDLNVVSENTYRAINDVVEIFNNPSLPYNRE